MIFSGKYEVIEKVGVGGMGIVYRVKHLDLDTELALKILPRHLSQDAELVERFRREARMMARLNHRNIVRVFDFVRDGDNYYLIMEFLEGRNLHQILQAMLKAEGHPMPLPEVLRVGLQIAEALAYAHTQNPIVVHRDIKPSNIIIEESEGSRAVVTDFGIAKHLGQSQSDLTRSGLFVGTPKYCAPEQLRHDDDLDARVDLYSLGMVLYELYTGRQYFAGLKDHEVIGRVLYEKVANTVVFPDAPPEFVCLVERAIALDRDTRYPTAALMVTDLQACLRALGADTPGAREIEPAAERPAPPRDEDVDIDKEIAALEQKRRQRRAQQAERACRQARTAAEARDARTEAPTEFGEAAARHAEAEEMLRAEDYEVAITLFEQAGTLFEAAATRGDERRSERRVGSARDAMAAAQERAAAANAATLAADEWRGGQALARAAEASLEGAAIDRAVAQFGEAAEAFGAALASATRAHELEAISAELPEVAAARAAAERAEAPVLASDVFEEAVRVERELQAAVNGGQLTGARLLIGRARERYAAAEQAAAVGRATRAAQAARARMEAARDAARAAGASSSAATELTAAAEREAAADAALRAREWERAEVAFDAAAEQYGRVREVAMARAEEQRVRRALDEARSAMETARDAASAARAMENAPTLCGQAREFAEHAAEVAARGELDDAAAQYRRAAEQYAHAKQVAEHRARRREVESLLEEVAAIRARAEKAGAGGEAGFIAASEAEARAREALGADELDRGAEQAALARTRYGDAEAAAARTQALAAADEVLARLADGRARAVGAGAERAAPAELEAADRLHAEARARRRDENAAEAQRLASEAAKRYETSLAAAVEALRADVETAMAAAQAAGATAADVKGAEQQHRAATTHARSGAPTEAAAAYRDAAKAYRDAIARAERRARRAALEKDVRELEPVREDAAAAGARDKPAFAAAERAEATARRALDDDDLDAAAQAITTARAGYADAHAAVDQERQLARADEALAQAAARREEVLGVEANRAAPNEYVAAERDYNEARQCRGRNDGDAALRRARDATTAYGECLAAAARAASGDAAGARAATDLVGASAEELAAVVALEREATAHLETGKLTAAIAGFRRAAAGYRGITERTSAAATTARAAAQAARSEAENAAAPTRAADDFREGLRLFEAAESAFQGHRFGDAARSFDASVPRFAAATEQAGRARRREVVAACREEANAARSAAQAAEGFPALAGELAAARGALRNADVAAGREDVDAAESGYRDATTKFVALRAAAERAALQIEAGAAESRVRALRATRRAAAANLAARWRIGRADRAIARAARALAADDHRAACAEFLRAGALLEAVPAATVAEEATKVGTVVRPLPSRVGRSLWIAAAGAVSVALLVVLIVRAMRAPSTAEPPRIATKEKTVTEATALAPARPLATVVPNAPAAVPMPRIARIEPSDAAVRAENGSRVPFRIELADARGASYAWRIDGHAVDDAGGPALSVTAMDEPQEVEVQARTAGGVVSQRWQLAARPRATVEAPPAALALADQTPRDTSLEAALGSSRRFGVTVKGGSRDRLAYAWSIDGRRVGSDAPSWNFTPSDDDEGREHKVKVEVTGQPGQRASAEWTVAVPAAPVQIVRKTPQQDPTVPLGGETDLAVDARVPARSGVPLSYRWSVNRRPLPDATGPRLTYRVDRPQADVEVTVEAPGRVAAVERWRVRGQAPPTPNIASPNIASPQREIEAWIEAYRTAYQEKNVDRLIGLGVVPPDQRAKMMKILDDLDGLEVRITSRSVDPQGDDTAAVTLTRVDSFLVGGSRTEKVISIKKTLHKRNGVWVAQ